MFQDANYRAGYLCGLIRGDGTIGDVLWLVAECDGANYVKFRLSMCDSEAVERARSWLSYRCVETRQYAF